MPLISVIVPVYNVEKYLERCVDSILNQTFKDFELILVDDGSPDRCGEICDKYAQYDKRVHVIHQQNSGLSAARNAGIDWIFQFSESEWLTFVDSDDWVHKDYLSVLINCAMDNDLKVCLCSYMDVTDYVIDAEYSEHEIVKTTPEELFITSITDATIAWGKIYEKSKFKNIRYPIGKLHEDVYVTHLLLFSEKNLGHVKAPLYYYYYTNPEAITQSRSDKKVIDELDGRRIRLRYLQENNFEKAYKFEVNSIAYNALELNAIGLTSDSNNYHKISLQRKRIRKTLRKNRLEFSKYIWVYELAYPNLMKLYWFIVAGVNKLKRMLQINWQKRK